LTPIPSFSATCLFQVPSNLSREPQSISFSLEGSHISFGVSRRFSEEITRVSAPVSLICEQNLIGIAPCFHSRRNKIRGLPQINARQNKNPRRSGTCWRRKRLLLAAREAWSREAGSNQSVAVWVMSLTIVPNSHYRCPAPPGSTRCRKSLQ
jgi:hypothetical protein